MGERKRRKKRGRVLSGPGCRSFLRSLLLLLWMVELARLPVPGNTAKDIFIYIFFPSHDFAQTQRASFLRERSIGPAVLRLLPPEHGPLFHFFPPPVCCVVFTMPRIFYLPSAVLPTTVFFLEGEAVLSAAALSAMRRTIPFQSWATFLRYGLWPFVTSCFTPTVLSREADRGREGAGGGVMRARVRFYLPPSTELEPTYERLYFLFFFYPLYFFLPSLRAATAQKNGRQSAGDEAGKIRPLEELHIRVGEAKPSENALAGNGKYARLGNGANTSKKESAGTTTSRASAPANEKHRRHATNDVFSPSSRCCCCRHNVDP